MSALLRITLLAVLIFGAVPSRADEKSTCLTTYVDGQALRKDGRLRDATEAFRVCAQPSCPVRLSQNCLIWLREVEALVPSIVVSAHDASGPRRDLRLEVDGSIVQPSLAGAPLSLDPGRHRLRLVGPDVDVTHELEVRAGEQQRGVDLEVSARPAASENTTKKIPPLSFVLGGVGVVGLGVWGTFGLLGVKERSDLDECKGSCSESQADSARTKLLVADIGLGTAIVAFAAATIVWLTSPSPRKATRVGSSL